MKLWSAMTISLVCAAAFYSEPANGQSSGDAAAASNREEANSLTIYSTAKPGAIQPSVYQPSYRKLQGFAPDYEQAVPGYATVRQQRRMKIDGGQSQLRFTDVAALIEPTTVMFTSITDPKGTSVIEQNFEFDLVSPQKLLERFIDRPVELMYTLPDGSFDSVKGDLLSSSGGNLVLRTADSAGPIQILQQAAARVKLGELPGGLITRPTLVWMLNSQSSGEQVVRVSYQTAGMTWWADYNVTYEDTDDANRGLLDLSAWVSIVNQSGASYPEAQLKLIAGDVQRVEPEQQTYKMGVPRGGAMMEAAAPQFAEKAFFEYHLYTLQRKTTLPQNSTKQIELFPSVRKVPCEKIYLYSGLPDHWGYGGLRAERDLGIPMNKKVDVYLRLANDEKSGMGMPLPSGRVRVNKLDSEDSSLEFIGENVIDHTAKNEKVLLKIGSAFDVVGERRQTDFSYDERRHVMTESFEIKVRNHKDTAVRVLIQEKLYRWSTWEIKEKSTDFEKQDVRTIHFPVDIKPDGEAVVTYTVKYTW